MARRLEIAFNEVVAGVFKLDSGLDGPDVLSDLGLYAGTFDDVTADVQGDITVNHGTDSLVGEMLAGDMSVTVSRPDAPGYWNSNNPSSPLNSVYPGFVPIRPARLVDATEDGTEYGVFHGFLWRDRWQAVSRSCRLYFRDVLARADRCYPIIPATGPTTTGAAIGLVLDAMGVPAGWRELDTGDALVDFSADGSATARSILNALVEAERGTIFVRGLDGYVVYESRSRAMLRAASGTFSTSLDLEDLETGGDADSIFTRSRVTRTSGAGDTTWSSVDAESERRFGRADIPAISSPYIPAVGGQDLADDLVYAGAVGKPPTIAHAHDVDDATLELILTTQLQHVLAIDDALGGTEGDHIVQAKTHTLGTGYHKVDYTLTKRAARIYTLDSALDGPDVFRY